MVAKTASKTRSGTVPASQTLTTPKVKAPTGAQAVVIPKMAIQLATIRLIGDSPLIVHAWSHKARQEMLDKQMGKAKAAKAPKDPEQDFQGSLYRDATGRLAFPAIAFKSAAVDACSHVAGITKVEARGSFHIIGELLPIEGAVRRREDMVRISMTTDIRFRGEFPEWAVEVPIRFNSNVLTLEQIINLFETAGFAIGVGEWRPEKNGSNGMFHVARESK